MTKAIIIDALTFQHSAGAELNNMALHADMKRLGDKATDEFRDSFMAGSIAARMGFEESGAASEILAKASPLVRKPAGKETDKQWADRQADRRAKIKAGELTERNKVEQQAYAAAKSKLSYWLAKYGIDAAQQRKNDASKAKLDAAKAKQAAKVEKDRLAKPDAELTPTANSVTSADKFIRQQVAMLLAYSEKNKPLVSPAMRDVIVEAYENLKAIPQADDEAAE